MLRSLVGSEMCIRDRDTSFDPQLSFGKVFSTNGFFDYNGFEINYSKGYQGEPKISSSSTGTSEPALDNSFNSLLKCLVTSVSGCKVTKINGAFGILYLMEISFQGTNLSRSKSDMLKEPTLKIFFFDPIMKIRNSLKCFIPVSLKKVLYQE